MYSFERLLQKIKADKPDVELTEISTVATQLDQQLDSLQINWTMPPEMPVANLIDEHPFYQLNSKKKSMSKKVVDVEQLTTIGSSFYSYKVENLLNVGLQ